MNKKFTIMLLSLMLVATSFGARLTQKQMTFLSEFDVLVTDLTSVEIKDAGTATTASIYSDRNGQTSMTNPIVSGLGSGLITFWSKDADYRCTATDGTYTRTVDNITSSDGRFAFPTYLVAMSSLTVGVNETITFGSADWVLAAQDSTFDATPGADDSAFAIGTASYTSDLLLYGASGYHLIWDASEYTLELLDNTVLAIGGGDDYTISHNGSTTTVAGAFTCSGIPTFSTDVIFDGTYNIKYDDDRYQLHFQDSAVLGIGGDADAVGDITFVHNGTDFLMEAATADDLWKIGATTNFDIGIYGDTNTDFVYFDTSEELVYLDGFDMRFNDDDLLIFGDSSEFTIEYDEDGTDNLFIVAGTANDGVQIGDGTTATDLILQSTGDASAQVQFDASGDTANGQMLFGADDHGIDVIFYGATASQKAWWDQSGDQWYFGADAEGVDVTFYSDVTTKYMKWDEDGSTNGALVFEDSIVHMMDDTFLVFGDGSDVTVNYDEDGEDNLQVKGPVDLETTYVIFTESPVTAAVEGGAATGTAGDENVMLVGYPAVTFEYHIIGTASQLAPSIDTQGLNIEMDAAQNDGLEITEGITARSRSSFTSGTDAFYFEVVFYTTDADGSADLRIGFRSVQAYDATIDNYDEMSAVGMKGVDWYSFTINGDGATGETDITPSGGDMGDAESHTVRISINADLSTDYAVDGAEPTAFPDTDVETGIVFIPFFYYISASATADGLMLTSWECGLQ